MTDKERGRTHRFRRWLAYKLLPGTCEFDVAMSRKLALFHMKAYYDATPDLHKSKNIERTYDRVTRDIPVRPEWDKSDEFRPNTNE